MAVPFLNLSAQYALLKPQMDEAIQHVLDTNAFALGPAVEKFEKEFAAFCGTKHCIGVGSGTAALSLLLQGHGIGPGDDVITVANSFFASAEAISLIGATPALVDCEETYGHIDVRKIEAAITPRTRAIIPVHLYGQPADMPAILSIAKAHKLLVIEDACQAHGASLNGDMTGSLADGAAFSFYPGKNLGAYGEGGAVTVNDDTVASKIRALRDHGMTEKYVHALIGWNERLDGIQGAVLGVKLPHLRAWNDARHRNAQSYRKKLEGIGDIRFFGERPGSTHNYHLFVIRTGRRDALQAHLKEKNIGTGIHYPIPIHLQKAYDNRGWKAGDFPVAEKLATEILSLPMFPELTEAQIDEVCGEIGAFFA